MICEHALTELCACIPRRPPAYVAPHVEMRGPGERVPPWSCQCIRDDGRPLLRKHRHTSPWLCIPEAVVHAFCVLHPEIKTLENARRMLWLEKNFAPQTLALAVKG